MDSKEFKKPEVKFYLTSNPPRLINVWLKSSIARPVLKALRDARLPKQAKKFKNEYELTLYRLNDFYSGLHGTVEILEPFYYREFFELASKYVDIEMYRDFRQYTEDYDEDLRRQKLLTPEDIDIYEC